MHIIDIIVFLLFTGGVVAFGCSFYYYADILYGVDLSESKDMIWPFWLAGDTEKEVIGWLE